MQDFRPITWDLPLVRARWRRLGVGRNDVASGVIVGGGVGAYREADHRSIQALERPVRAASVSA